MFGRRAERDSRINQGGEGTGPVTSAAPLEFTHVPFTPFITRRTAHLLSASRAKDWRFRLEENITLPSWSLALMRKEHNEALKAGWPVPW